MMPDWIITAGGVIIVLIMFVYGIAALIVALIALTIIAHTAWKVLRK